MKKLCFAGLTFFVALFLSPRIDVSAHLVCIFGGVYEYTVTAYDWENYVGVSCGSSACYAVYDHDWLDRQYCMNPSTGEVRIDHLDKHGNGYMAATPSQANHKHQVYIGPPGCSPGPCPEP